jgi:hypothetical protein
MSNTLLDFLEIGYFRMTFENEKWSNMNIETAYREILILMFG